MKLTDGQRRYREYLRSPHWKETAKYFKELRNYTCEVCRTSSEHVHLDHNGSGDGYQDESGRSLLWRERERPRLMQVLCEACHDRKHGRERFPPPWLTEEEADAINQAEGRRRREKRIPEGMDPDELAREIVERELLINLGLDPGDPDPSDVAAEGMAGDPDGNYDGERDDQDR